MLKDAAQTTPVEDVLAAGGDTPVAVITKLRLMRMIGWPGARTSLHDNSGGRVLVRADAGEPAIWELKVKPHCWRLYFCVYEKTHNFAFLHAVCKKTTSQDPGDIAIARRVLNELSAGRVDLTHLPLEA